MKAVVALSFAGCTPLKAPLGTLRIGMPAWHWGIDPYLQPYADVAERSWIVGEGLPSLADRIEGDASRYLYRLRRGARWHDGSAVRAEHICACFRRLLSAHPAWRGTHPYSRVRTIEALDGLTVRVVLTRPTGDFTQTFFAPFGNFAVPLIRETNGRIVGTAPFRLLSHDDETFAFGAAPGTAKVRSLKLRLFPDDGTALVALQSGEIDAIVDADRAASGTPGMHAVSRLAAVTFVLANTQGTLREASLRRRVLRAIDASDLARRAYQEQSTDELMPSLHIAIAPSAGSADAQVRVAFPRTQTGEKAALLLADALRRRRVNAKLQSAPLVEYESVLRSGDFDLALYGAPYSNAEDVAVNFSCRERAPAGHNYARMCDPALDSAFARGNVRLAAERLSKDAVVRVIAQYHDHALVSSRVRLPFPRAPFVPWFHDVSRWSVS